MMEKLADLCIRRGKLIIILWIIVLLFSAPFAYMVMTSDSKLTYDISGMEGDNSESTKGYELLDDTSLFPSSGESGTGFIIVAMLEGDDIAKARAGVEYLMNSLKVKIDEKYKDRSYTIAITQSEGESRMSLITINKPSDAGNNDFVKDIRGWTIEIRNGAPAETPVGTTYLTGGAAITYDIAQSAVNDVKRIDPFSILLVLILIGLFFRSLVSAAMPPLTIGIAYALTLMAVFGIAEMIDIYYITTTLTLVSMLGAGCDYCIFIIARYREERKAGKTKDEALTEAVKWAGESVAVSGLCVIIGFGVMSACSYSLIGSMGIVLALGIVFALVAALTLIPSIIAITGDRIFYPSKVEDYTEGSKTMNGWFGKFSELGRRYFRSSSDFSMRHAWAIIIAAIVITVPLTYVAATESTSFDMVETMPNVESKKGIELIENEGYGGLSMPTYIVAELANGDFASFDKRMGDDGVEYGILKWKDDAEAAKLMASTTYVNISEEVKLDDCQGLMKKIMSNENTKSNVYVAMGAFSWKLVVYSVIEQSEGQIESVEEAEGFINMKLLEYNEEYGLQLAKIRNAFPDAENREVRFAAIDYALNASFLGSISQQKDGHQYVKITIVLKDQPMSDRSLQTSLDIRSSSKEYVANQITEEMPEIKSTLTTGTSAALVDVSDKVSTEFKIIEVVVILLIIVLLLFVMRSYITPIRSVATIVMGIMWSLGATHLLFGHVLNMPILWLVPIVLFVICLGLGMDYDVLLTTRIKEYVGKGMDNDTAIEQALEHSGAIITICGLIMGGAFLTMVLSTSPMLQQFGFTLGFAILIDALVIRTYVVPATMHLLGRWNWVGPKFLQRRARTDIRQILRYIHARDGRTTNAVR